MPEGGRAIDGQTLFGIIHTANNHGRSFLFRCVMLASAIILSSLMSPEILFQVVE